MWALLLLLNLAQIASVLGDFCDPNCNCSSSPVISVQCNYGQLKVCTYFSDYQSPRSNVDYLQIIPSTLDPQIQRLELNYNELRQIGSASFQFHPDLLQVDLANNQLQYIQDKTFEAQRILQTLILSHNRLSFMNNSTFHGLSSLEQLDLSHNAFTVLNDFALENLHKLKELKLNGNKISVISVNAFSGLNYLLSLNLAQNELLQVESRPLSLVTSLTNLNLSGNRISELRPNSLSFLSWLTSLDLSANPLETEKVSGLSLTGLVSLSSLNMSDLNISSLPTNLLLPPSALTELLLDRTNIGEISASAFLSLRRLQHLSVSGCSRLVRIHEASFLPCPGLTVLNLSDNPRLSVLPPPLLATLSNLSRLDVRRCGLTSLTVPDTSVWSPVRLDLSDNPWRCDCGMVSVYRLPAAVRGAVTCHQPPGLTLDTANMTQCDSNSADSPEEAARRLVIVTVVVTVVGIVLLTLVGVVGCRYQDKLVYILFRLDRRRCPHQDSLQAFQDTEEFIHFSSSQHQHKLPTRPVPVTEL